jgi:methylenetetrahydrofolate dehydrogenase (NADP+)/methenyltetrahydrofolate cyclohydrolase
MLEATSVARTMRRAPCSGKRKMDTPQGRSRLLSGAEPAKAVQAQLKRRIEAGSALSELHLKRRLPCLAVVVVGERPDSKVYVRIKKRVGGELGIEVRVIELEETVSRDQLQSCIHDLNKDGSVDGVIVQVPLPCHLPVELCQEIDQAKDVDGFSFSNIGKLALNGVLVPLFSPCTPRGIMELLEYHGVAVRGKHVVIVGRSAVVGMPLSLMMLQADATVTICHSRTGDLKAFTLLADILVVAVGRAGLVKADWIKSHCVVVDVGVSLVDGAICGDVDAAEVLSETCASLTPVPGGVGPMTVSMLMKAVVEAWERRMMCAEMSLEK